MSDTFRPFAAEEAWQYAPTLTPEPDFPAVPGFTYLQDTTPKCGGFGFVYHALQLEMGRPVALKVAHSHRRGASDEAKRIAQFKHPNIVSVYTAGEFRGRPWLAAEWMAGGDLLEQLKVSRTPRQWAEVFIALADALAAVHVVGIHRDIKPANILFDEHGTAKLSDFGLAVRGYTADSDSGTRGYFIPGEAHSPLSDIYALGVTLRQCLTGQTDPEKVLAGRPVRVPRTLFAIAQKSLAEQPASRYGDAEQPAKALADDLRKWLDHRPTHADPLGPARWSVLFARRWWKLLSVAAVVVTLLSFSGVSAWQAIEALAREKKAETAKAVAERKTADETKEKLEAVQKVLDLERQANAEKDRQRTDEYQRQLKEARELLAAGRSPEAVVALNGCAEALRNAEWESLIGRCDAPLAEAKFPSRVVAVASDGRGNVAVGLWGGEVFVGPLTRVPPKTSPHREPPSREMQRLFFAAGGRLVITSVSRTPGKLVTVVIVDRQSGLTLRENLLPDECPAGVPAEPALSPDGKTLVFPGALGTLKVLDVSTGEVRVITDKLSSVTALAWRNDDTIAAAVGDDVRFWKGGAELPAWKAGTLRSVAFAADGAMIGVDGSGGLKMWKTDGTPLSFEVKSPRANLRRVIAAPGRSAAFATVGDNGVTVWTKGGESLTPRDLLGTAVVFTANGSRVLTGDVAGTVWEWSTGPTNAVPATK